MGRSKWGTLQMFARTSGEERRCEVRWGVGERKQTEKCRFVCFGWMCGWRSEKGKGKRSVTQPGEQAPYPWAWPPSGLYQSWYQVLSPPPILPWSTNSDTSVTTTHWHSNITSQPFSKRIHKSHHNGLILFAVLIVHELSSNVFSTSPSWASSTVKTCAANKLQHSRLPSDSGRERKKIAHILLLLNHIQKPEVDEKTMYIALEARLTLKL